MTSDRGRARGQGRAHRSRGPAARLALAAGFTTLFFAGASFTAGAGDNWPDWPTTTPPRCLAEGSRRAAPAEAQPAEAAPAEAVPAAEPRRGRAGRRTRGRFRWLQPLRPPLPRPPLPVSAAAAAEATLQPEAAPAEPAASNIVAPAPAAPSANAETSAPSPAPARRQAGRTAHSDHAVGREAGRHHPGCGARDRARAR